MRSPKQNEVKDVENGQAKTLKYISVNVAKHKTSRTYGTARITLPEAILFIYITFLSILKTHMVLVMKA